MKILSIRGGGIKGLVAARILQRFENETGSAVRDHFDFIAGTSTGGILAIALSLGIPARDIVEMYRVKGPEIFRRRWHRQWGLTKSKYRSEDLRAALVSVFTDSTMLPEDRFCFVTSVDLHTGSSVFFKSWKDRVLAVDAAMATSSAPTYFDPVRIWGDEYFRHGRFVDGGLFANNPASFALTEVLKLHKLAPSSVPYPHLLVDLSCGEKYRDPLIESRWGALSYASHLVGLFIDSGMDAAAYQCRCTIGDSYLPVIPNLRTASASLDDASRANISALIDSADLFADLNSLIQKVTKR